MFMVMFEVGMMVVVSLLNWNVSIVVWCVMLMRFVRGVISGIVNVVWLVLEWMKKLMIDWIRNIFCVVNIGLFEFISGVSVWSSVLMIWLLCIRMMVVLVSVMIRVVLMRLCVFCRKVMMMLLVDCCVSSFIVMVMMRKSVVIFLMY